MNHNTSKNGEGYVDPTAAKAIRQADKPPEQISWFIQTIKTLADVFDLQIIGRIKIRDKKTGKIYE